MALWRKAAIDRLPELREKVASAENVMSLWIELSLVFEEAYREPRDNDLIERIYSYARWCWAAPRSNEADHDPESAASVAFFEHIPSIPAAREDMPRWFTFEEVSAAKSLFCYAIGETAFKDLLAHMQRNSERYGKKP
jgi:hypothetical protein